MDVVRVTRHSTDRFLDRVADRNPVYPEVGHLASGTDTRTNCTRIVVAFRRGSAGTALDVIKDNPSHLLLYDFQTSLSPSSGVVGGSVFSKQALPAWNTQLYRLPKTCAE